MAEEDSPLFLAFGGVDGGPRIEFRVAPDEMTVWARFFRATTSNGKLLVWTELEEALRGAGLGPGLKIEVLQEAVFRFNTGHPDDETVVAAQGTAPVEERPAYLRLEPRFYQHHFVDQGGVQVDFKDYSPFLIVKKGELLARGIPPRDGVPGVNVFGVETAPAKKNIKLLRPGPRTLFAHGKVFAKVAGRFTLEGDVFDVNDLLELDAGVDYATGNIVFPGSMVVKGVVADGFRLAAGGTLTVKGPLDASEVLAHGDVTVEGGVLGKKPGVVRTGGKLRALFAENVQLEALGGIAITKAMLRCQVHCNGDVALDEGGRIVASSLWIKGNLTCSQLGGENGAVKVSLGSDFVVQRKIEALRAKYQGLDEALGREKKAGQDLDPAKLAALKELINDLNLLTPALFVNPRAEVRVSGRTFAGTIIEIGYAAYTVPETVAGRVFSLGGDGKTIAVRPYQKEQAPASTGA